MIVAEALERRERRIDGLRADDAGRRTCRGPSSTPRDASSMIAERCVAADLGDDEPDRARAHVEHGDQFGGGG